MRPPKHAVDFLTEGEILVRGTKDPIEAIRIFFEIGDLDMIEFLDGLFDNEPTLFDREANDWITPTPERIGRELGDWINHRLANAMPGHYRKVHCLPSSWASYEGWGWALHPANPGSGAFPAVEFLP